jgi:glycosyltransferase involved in cell wall biosynthesis
VDILYTRVERLVPHCFRGTFEHHVEACQREGITLACLAHDGEWNDWLAKSRQVMIHLAAQRYDHVFFNDMHAEGYYSLLERKTANPDFAGTSMAVVLHSATQWIAELNQQAVSSIEDIRLIEMERRCIELADAVISPSAYMLAKYKGYGWKTPDGTRVIPNLLPTEGQRFGPERRTRRVDEIVFFGRLERRKGIWLFCDAIDRLKHEIGDVRITFLGKLTTEDGELTGFPLLKRAAAWPFEIDIIHDFDREQALGYLKAGHRLAVMPAREDNSPCAILECLHEGIPFAAASGSGGQELIARDCWDENLFQPTVGALTEKLRSILRHGAATGLPATHPDQNETAILGWLSQTLTAAGVPRPRVRPPRSLAPRIESTPFHQIVLLSDGREGLDRRIAAIERAVELHPIRAAVTVLTDLSSGWTDQHSTHLDRLGVRVADVRSFPELATSLSQRSAAVAFARLTEPVTPAWLARAEHCFRHADDISALTGLTAVPDPSPQELPNYFGPNAPGDKVLDHRVGNAPVLFPLASDTNSGFISVRSDILERVTGISPFDDQYGRFKTAQDWVHEVVVRLVQHGKRFEVLAAPVLTAALVEEPSPVFWHGRTARSLVGSQLGHAPGSEQALLARLGMEANLAAGKKRAAAERLTHLSEKLGRRLDDPSLYGSDERTARALAAMARASGQIELAHELTAFDLLSRRDGAQEPQAPRRRRAPESDGDPSVRPRGRGCLHGAQPDPRMVVQDDRGRPRDGDPPEHLFRRSSDGDVQRPRPDRRQSPERRRPPSLRVLQASSFQGGHDDQGRGRPLRLRACRPSRRGRSIGRGAARDCPDPLRHQPVNRDGEPA